MIKGGYYLDPKRLYESIMDHAAPCTRELWHYFLKEANFTDSKNLKRGQLIKSYGQIQQDLSWRKGNTQKTYSLNQIKWAVSFLKKNNMIQTERITRGVLVTICNYSHIQNSKNYEPTTEPTEVIGEKHCKINELNTNLKPEPTAEPTEKGSEPTEKWPTEPTAEPTEDKREDHCKFNALERNKKTEPTTEPTAEPTEKCSTIHNIHQYRAIEYNINKKNLPAPENGECDFERDRRIFFQAFPGVKTFQTFDDNSDRKDKKLIRMVYVNDHMPMKITLGLEKLNSMGAGVYMAVNETNGNGRKATDVVRVRAVFADFDGVPIDPVWEYEPSMVIESSPGKYHAYWLSPDIPLDGFRQLQESIAVKFDSDPKVKDLPRVMRVPGFYHNKSTPFLTRILHYTGQQFTFEYLQDMFPPPPREKWSGEKYQTQEPSDGEFKGQYGASEGERNNHVAARIGGMLNRGLSWGEVENEAFKEGAACSPPLSEVEVRAILRSMRRYA